MGKTKSEHFKQSQSSGSHLSAPQKTDGNLTLHLADAAWRVAVPLLGLSLVGIWLDRRYETEPLFSLGGLFLGIAMAVLAMYRLLQVHFPETLDLILGKNTEEESK